MVLRLLGRPGRITRTSTFSSSQSIYRPIITTTTTTPIQQSSARNYASESEMRKSAFEDRLRSLIRNDVLYKLHTSPFTPLVPKFKSLAVDERPTDRCMKLYKKFGDSESIIIDTWFQANAPPAKDGVVTTYNGYEPYLPMMTCIHKNDEIGVLQFRCDIWPNRVEIKQVFMRDEHWSYWKPYAGPPFDELDDELQTALYDYLETRGINVELAHLLHKLMKHKRKNEYIRWMVDVDYFLAR
ncbi:uncharacterized protein At2g39790, mitochondrial-like [Rutidosis leptorrhynchoides]|uniref:uncharacterized protein At2g39790, mitochondrial-like n=1 Tax=Rutidosis leptorrhynchoides TaxID=125765 RepID=UPI003A9A1290